MSVVAVVVVVVIVVESDKLSSGKSKEFKLVLFDEDDCLPCGDTRDDEDRGECCCCCCCRC